MSAPLSERLRPVVPNLFTLMVSLGGLAAMGIAYYWHDRRAALMFLVCGLFDGLDGSIARRLNAQSRFGNIHDSMADFLAFGIAPVFTLLFLDLIHPGVALFYLLAIQFRLIRYSAMPDDESHGRFFQGLSSPDAVYMGVLIGLLPYSNFSIGYGLAGLMAIYPGRLWPKGFLPVKFAVGIATIILFLQQGNPQ